MVKPTKEYFEMQALHQMHVTLANDQSYKSKYMSADESHYMAWLTHLPHDQKKVYVAQLLADHDQLHTDRKNAQELQNNTELHTRLVRRSGRGDITLN